MSRILRIAKLLSQQRTQMALSPEFSLVRSGGRVAIRRDVFNDAMYKFEGPLPFNNLFGDKTTTRLVLPYENEVKYKLSQALGKSGELGEKGFDRIDWETGEAVKIVPPGPGAKEGAKPKEQRTKIGKAIARLPNAQEVLDWWSGNKDSAKTDDYLIVISRHPVDVIRMSDHENIESCHSPGEGHWSHCVSEMKHGGLVAYLVDSEELDGVPYDEISGKDEIFADPDRRIDGIIPKSRLRIRRFTHRHDGFDLALPEYAVYGEENSEFERQVDDSARSTQADLTKEKRWRMDEFARRGGEYTDTDDGDLFNKFFKDSEDHGKTEFGIPGEEEESVEAMNTQALNEIQDIHTRWQRDLDHCYTRYESDYGEEGHVYFYWSGGVRVEVPSNIVTASLDVIRKQLNHRSDSLEDYLAKKYFHLGGGYIDVVYRGDKIYFDMELRDDDGGSGDPDSYHDFCMALDGDFDSKYDELQKLVIQWLQESGFAGDSPLRTFDFSDLDLKHFKVDLDEDSGTMLATAEASIGDYDQELWSGGEFRGRTYGNIKELVSKELTRILQIQKRPQKYFPGHEPQNPVFVRGHYDLGNFDTYLRAIRGYQEVGLKIEFKASNLTTEQDLQEVTELMRVVDQIFPQIVHECKMMLEEFYDQKRVEMRNVYDQNLATIPFQLRRER